SSPKASPKGGSTLQKGFRMRRYLRNWIALSAIALGIGAIIIGINAPLRSQSSTRFPGPPEQPTPIMTQVKGEINFGSLTIPVEIQLARLLASGQPVTGVTWDVVDTINRDHAKENDNVTREAALALLETNSAAAAAAMRAFTDEELDRAALVSLNSDAPLTCHFFPGGSRGAPQLPPPCSDQSGADPVARYCLSWLRAEPGPLGVHAARAILREPPAQQQPCVRVQLAAHPASVQRRKFRGRTL